MRVLDPANNSSTICTPAFRGALDALAERAPLLEIGAGLGYWAAALRARGVSVHAVDSHPPGSSAVNTYHGRIPAFTKVNTRTQPIF